jgi:DNA-binding beta-propeller fold protein YncE
MHRVAILLLIGVPLGSGSTFADDPVGSHDLEGPVAVVWESRYDGPESSTDYAKRVAIESTASGLFITGHSVGGDGSGCATVAHDPLGGTGLWSACHGSPAYFDALAVSPEGSRLFVTGMATVAIDALTGSEIWRAGPSSDLVVSPDGTTLYQADRSVMCIDPCGCFTFCPFYVSAFDASNGSLHWSAPNGCGSLFCGADAVALSPAGDVLFVVGRRGPADAAGWKSLVAAYDTVGGDVLWTTFGLYHHWSVGPSPLAVSPDGATLYVTGTSGTLGSTAAYDAVSGAIVWTATVPGRSNRAVAATPDGARVLVTGARLGGDSLDYLTTALDAQSGNQIWSAPYDGPASGDDVAEAVAVAGDGSTTWVTGRSESDVGGPRDFVSVAYDTGGGTPLWVARYDGPAGGDDAATSLAVAPDGPIVYVTGSSEGPDGGSDYLTLAYSRVVGVEVDVKPGGSTNSVNPRSRGVLPVAVLGNANFDVNDIDDATLRLGVGPAACAHDLSEPFTRRSHTLDVNLDGYPDFVGHYRVQDSGILCGDSSVTVIGRTHAGGFFEGSDAIRTVGCR